MAHGELVEDLAMALDLPAELAIAPHHPQLGGGPADPPAVEPAALPRVEAADHRRRRGRIDLAGPCRRQLEADELARRGPLVRALAEAPDEARRERDAAADDEHRAADDSEHDEDVEGRAVQAVGHRVGWLTSSGGRTSSGSTGSPEA